MKKKILFLLSLVGVLMLTLTACDTANITGEGEGENNETHIHNYNTQSPTKLATPTSVKAATGNGNVTISWGAVPYADGYDVYRTDSVNGKVHIGRVFAPNVTFYHIIGDSESAGITDDPTDDITSCGFAEDSFEVNVTYYYSVMAKVNPNKEVIPAKGIINGEGSEVRYMDSNESAAATARFTDLPAKGSKLATVTGVRAVNDGLDRYLFWDKVENATAYEIYGVSTHSTDYRDLEILGYLTSGKKPIDTVNNTNLTYKLSTTTVEYAYYVRALKSDNYFLPSAFNKAEGTDAIVGPNVVLSKPSDVTVDTVYTNKFMVKWANVEGADNYEVWRAKRKEKEFDNDDDWGEYTLLATGAAGTDSFYDSSSFEHTIYEDSDSTIETGTSINRQQYKYQIVAINITDNLRSAAAESSAVSLPNPEEVSSFAAPTGVSATDGLYANKINVTWNIVDEAVSYRVYRRFVDDVSGDITAYELLENPTYLTFENNIKITGIADSDGLKRGNSTDDVIYYYRVIAVDSTGRISDLSSEDSGYITDQEDPKNDLNIATPTSLLQEDNSQTTVTLQWNKSLANGDTTTVEADSYNIYYSDNASGDYVLYEGTGVPTNVSGNEDRLEMTLQVDSIWELGINYYVIVEALNSEWNIRSYLSDPCTMQREGFTKTVIGFKGDDLNQWDAGTNKLTITLSDVTENASATGTVYQVRYAEATSDVTSENYTTESVVVHSTVGTADITAAEYAALTSGRYSVTVTPAPAAGDYKVVVVSFGENGEVGVAISTSTFTK